MDLTAEFTWESLWEHLAHPMSVGDRQLDVLAPSQDFPPSHIFLMTAPLGWSVCIDSGDVEAPGVKHGGNHHSTWLIHVCAPDGDWTEHYLIDYFDSSPFSSPRYGVVTMDGEPGMPLPPDTPERALEKLRERYARKRQ